MNRGFISLGIGITIAIVAAVTAGGGYVVYKANESRQTAQEAPETKQNQPEATEEGAKEESEEYNVVEVATSTTPTTSPDTSEEIVQAAGNEEPKETQTTVSTPQPTQNISQAVEMTDDTTSVQDVSDSPATTSTSTDTTEELGDFELSCELTEDTITVGDDVEIALDLEGNTSDYSIEWDNRYLVVGNDTKTGLFEIDDTGEKKIWAKVTRKADEMSKTVTCEIAVEPLPEPELEPEIEEYSITGRVNGGVEYGCNESEIIENWNDPEDNCRGKISIQVQDFYSNDDVAVEIVDTLSNEKLQEIIYDENDNDLIAWWRFPFEPDTDYPTIKELEHTKAPYVAKITINGEEKVSQGYYQLHLSTDDVSFLVIDFNPEVLKWQSVREID